MECLSGYCACFFDMRVLSKSTMGFTVKYTGEKIADVIQNEGMRAILGCTKDTSAAAMRYALGYLACHA